MLQAVRSFTSLVAIALTLAACGSPSAPAPTVTSVAVTGTAPPAGSSSQFTAVAALSDGSALTVTNQATWQTSNPVILTVTNTGVVTGVNGGTTEVWATYRQVRGIATVTIGTSICVFSLEPRQITAPNGGGSFSVQLTYLQGPCGWTAQSNDAFITITSGTSGFGNAGVFFSVAANPGGPRSGTLTVAGVTVTVNQS